MPSTTREVRPARNFRAPLPLSAVESFRFLDLTLGDVASDLAMDEALLNLVEETDGPPVLRLWEAPEFTVVLGASGRIVEDVRVEACQADGVGLARRSSGGGTVVIGPGALNATVILPRDAAPGLEWVETAQLYVLERLAETLRPRVPGVVVLGSGDLALDHRKFAGSAQRRMRRHFLVHASILYAFPLDRIERYLAEPIRQPAYREGRPHARFLTNLGLPREELVRALREAWLTGVVAAEPLPVPDERIRALRETKFADPAWIERF